MAHRKKRRGKKPKPPVFRSQVETEVIDQMLGRFVALVKRGLELILTEPSELVQAEFRQQPELAFQAKDIPALVLWTAVGGVQPAGVGSTGLAGSAGGVHCHRPGAGVRHDHPVGAVAQPSD